MSEKSTSKNKKRCDWCGDDPLYVSYHDKEWGVPSKNDRHLFEMLILEGAQAGLSWITVLRKRKEYKKVFKNFDPKLVAKISKREQQQILKNPGIIRNRLKVESAVINAKAFLEIQNEFGTFSRYLWSFVDNKPVVSNFKKLGELLARTKISDNLSKDLKKRGFKFVGSTICYAYMQAVGLANDHLTSCFCRK